ncbi:hypothetical protein [Hydrogeniiclostridium mannosilyticum]|uniref:hypothetical protein n=1 Tax=Hydrogeniiclostridium mannosilyticum TaxID=2764322 RepID=UPI003999D9A4
MAKRNAQGSGSIRERKPGLWEARYTLSQAFVQWQHKLILVVGQHHFICSFVFL